MGSILLSILWQALTLELICPLHSSIHSLTYIHPGWAEAEWISAVKLMHCRLQCEPVKRLSLIRMPTVSVQHWNHSTAHSRRRCRWCTQSAPHTHYQLIMCMLLLCPTSREKQSRPASVGRRGKCVYSLKRRNMMRRGGGPWTWLAWPQRYHPFTWAQASGPSAQVYRQGQVDVIVALSLPAGPVERKLSVLSPLQGGD